MESYFTRWILMYCCVYFNTQIVPYVASGGPFNWLHALWTCPPHFAEHFLSAVRCFRLICTFLAPALELAISP